MEAFAVVPDGFVDVFERGGEAGAGVEIDRESSGAETEDEFVVELPRTGSEAGDHGGVNCYWEFLLHWWLSEALEIETGLLFASHYGVDLILNPVHYGVVGFAGFARNSLVV